MFSIFPLKSFFLTDLSEEFLGVRGRFIGHIQQQAARFNLVLILLKTLSRTGPLGPPHPLVLRSLKVEVYGVSQHFI